MGYTTKFIGQFNVHPRMSKEHAEYLAAFSARRRMGRDPAIASELPDPKRAAVGLPIGNEGGYFVGGSGYAGQERDRSVIDFNREPSGQPGLRCQWTPAKDRRGLKWNGVERFYDYTEWLNYLIEHFLEPWGYKVDGEVRYAGEDRTDRGVVRIVKGRAKKVAYGVRR